MEPISTNSSSQISRYSPRGSGSDAAPEQQAISFSERPKFVSPKGNIDPQSGVYVVQFRNAATGNVDFQYPNKKAVAEYTRSNKLIPAQASEGTAKVAVTSQSSARGSESGSVADASASSTQSSGGSSTGPAQLGTTDNE